MAVGVRRTPGVRVIVARRHVCIVALSTPCIHLIDLLCLLQEVCFGGERFPVNSQLRSWGCCCCWLGCCRSCWRRWLLGWRRASWRWLCCRGSKRLRRSCCWGRRWLCCCLFPRHSWLLGSWLLARQVPSQRGDLVRWHTRLRWFWLGCQWSRSCFQLWACWRSRWLQWQSSLLSPSLATLRRWSPPSSLNQQVVKGPPASRHQMCLVQLRWDQCDQELMSHSRWSWQALP